MRYAAHVVLVAFLLGASVASGLCVGFVYGKWWGEWELFYLMDVPQGGIVLSQVTNAYWHKMPNDTLRFVRIPDPRQARTTRMFPKREEGKDEKDVDSDKRASASGK